MAVKKAEIAAVKKQILALVEVVERDTTLVVDKDDILKNLQSLLTSLGDLTFIGRIRTRFHAWIRNKLAQVPNTVPTIETVRTTLAIIERDYEDASNASKLEAAQQQLLAGYLPADNAQSSINSLQDSTRNTVSPASSLGYSGGGAGQPAGHYASSNPSIASLRSSSHYQPSRSSHYSSTPPTSRHTSDDIPGTLSSMSFAANSQYASSGLGASARTSASIVPSITSAHSGNGTSSTMNSYSYTPGSTTLYVSYLSPISHTIRPCASKGPISPTETLPP
ncbi:uncharacterized protein BT62DRAFT_489228 [Guyanagaster necrorhizus]|uniref:Uncharacterized protein n=1 Tax=Guyanagaster necrorhizus TaxID=856835 RepID=A0A9P7VJX4_9AGAR|nr:uncharacterized protein BT62DRAFT_489228 [Guyanagaster necrorhizus MCA 3950]KAG7441299.1 hypothetical protein BT62DRAFT_489228 [Guyanagaster necrorhizus MCA 3950]